MATVRGDVGDLLGLGGGEPWGNMPVMQQRISAAFSAKYGRAPTSDEVARLYRGDLITFDDGMAAQPTPPPQPSQPAAAPNWVHNGQVAGALPVVTNLGGNGASAPPSNPAPDYRLVDSTPTPTPTPPIDHRTLYTPSPPPAVQQPPPFGNVPLAPSGTGTTPQQITLAPQLPPAGTHTPLAGNVMGVEQTPNGSAYVTGAPGYINWERFNENPGLPFRGGGGGQAGGNSGSGATSGSGGGGNGMSVDFGPIGGAPNGFSFMPNFTFDLSKLPDFTGANRSLGNLVGGINTIGTGWDKDGGLGYSLGGVSRSLDDIYKTRLPGITSGLGGINSLIGNQRDNTGLFNPLSRLNDQLGGLSRDYFSGAGGINTQLGQAIGNIGSLRGDLTGLGSFIGQQGVPGRAATGLYSRLGGIDDFLKSYQGLSLDPLTNVLGDYRGLQDSANTLLPYLEDIKGAASFLKGWTPGPTQPGMYGSAGPIDYTGFETRLGSVDDDVLTRLNPEFDTRFGRIDDDVLSLLMPQFQGLSTKFDAFDDPGGMLDSWWNSKFPSGFNPNAGTGLPGFDFAKSMDDWWGSRFGENLNPFADAGSTGQIGFNPDELFNDNLLAGLSEKIFGKLTSSEPWTKFMANADRLTNWVPPQSGVTTINNNTYAGPAGAGQAPGGDGAAVPPSDFWNIPPELLGKMFPGDGNGLEDLTKYVTPTGYGTVAGYTPGTTNGAAGSASGLAMPGMSFPELTDDSAAMRQPYHQSLLDALGSANPFDTRRDAITAGPNAAIEQQFKEASDNITNRYAVQGNLGSPAYRAEMRKLEEEKARQKLGIQSQFGMEAARTDEDLRRNRLSDLGMASSLENNRVNQQLSLYDSLQRSSMGDYYNWINAQQQADMMPYTFQDQSLMQMLSALGGTNPGSAEAAMSGLGQAATTYANRGANQDLNTAGLFQALQGMFQPRQTNNSGSASMPAGWWGGV